MDPDYDRNLEPEIDRELKGLGELRAPDSLMRRVFAELELRAQVPWYRRRWQHWPVAWQCAVGALLLVVVGGLGFGAVQLLQMGSVTSALRQGEIWLSGFSAVGRAVAILLNAGVLLFKQLGAGLIAACLIATALLYAICVGLGSVCFRLAVTNR